MPAIQAITLDFWNTIFRDQPGKDGLRTDLRVGGIARFLGALGFTYTDAELRAAHAAVGSWHRAIQAEGRDVSLRSQLGFMLDQLQPELAGQLAEGDLAALADLYAAPTLAVPPEPLLRDLPSLLAALRGRGLRIGLISNTGRTPGTGLRVVLAQAGALPYFDQLTFSDEVALAKPNPAIFWHTLEALGIEPSAAVHVGDDQATDVVGAHQAGMRVALVGSRSSADPAGPAESPDRWMDALDALPAALEDIEAEDTR
jgi:putative hydrolase of the HAD superfamily